MATASTPTLTKRQAQCYAYLVDYFREFNRMPTFRDIGRAMRMKSPAAPRSHLVALARKGLIELGEIGEARSVQFKGVRFVPVIDEDGIGPVIRGFWEGDQ